jgi:hypothetical protein
LPSNRASSPNDWQRLAGLDVVEHRLLAVGREGADLHAPVQDDHQAVPGIPLLEDDVVLGVADRGPEPDQLIQLLVRQGSENVTVTEGISQSRVAFSDHRRTSNAANLRRTVPDPNPYLTR